MSEITLKTIGDNLRERISEKRPRLLSEVDLSDEELEYLRANGSVLVTNAISGYSIFDIQTAYLMMDIGMRNYHEGTYWEDLWKAVGRGDECNINYQNPLGTFFIETMDRYHLAYRGPEDRRRFVNSIMMNAFIPEEQKYRNGFFDFIQKFYRLVLNSSIPDDLDKHLQVIADVFRNNSELDYPEFANLHLIRSTRIVLSDVCYFGHTVTKILRRLANDYDSPEDVNLGRYEKSFKEWMNDSALPRSKHYGMINERPYIHYDSSMDRLSLIVPVQSIDESRRNNLEIKSSSGEVLYGCNLHAVLQFGRKITEETLVSISWNPLDEFTVWIGGKVCHRFTNFGFILLSSKGNNRSRVSAGFNMIILPKGIDLDIVALNLSNMEDYHIDGFMLGHDSSVMILGHRYSVETDLSPNIHIITPRLDVGCVDQDGNKYDLYSEHPLIGINDTKTLKSVKMYIGHGYNGVQIDLRGRSSARQDPDHPGYESVIDPRSEGLAVEAGIFHIRVNAKELYKYVLIPKFDYSFKREIYTKDETSKVLCSVFDDPIEFVTTQGIVETPTITVDGRDITLRMQVPSRRFSFDKKKWLLFGSELYYRDTEYTDLYIYGPTPVFPCIYVDYPESKPQNLNMEGPFMTCKFDRISRISTMIEYNPMKTTSMLKFLCDRQVLFIIRYNADYKISEDNITRSNPPENTRALIREIGTDREVEFDGNHVIIPYDFGDYDLIEVYDGGFISQERKVATVNRRLRLQAEAVGNILSGEDFTEIVCNGMKFTGREFRNLVSWDRKYDPYVQNNIARRYESQGEPAYNTYLEVVSAIKDVIAGDKNVSRLKTRIMRFKDADPEFTLRLCNQYLVLSEASKMSDDSEISRIRGIWGSLVQRCISKCVSM